MDREAMAVLSHGLLGTVSSLIDATTRLATRWPSLNDDDRAMLLDAVRGHACWIGDVLEGLVRGLPDDVLIALDHQDGRARINQPVTSPPR